jgi:hypothetical protein
MNASGTGSLITYRTVYYPNTGGYNQDWQAPAGDPYDVQDTEDRYIGDDGNAEFDNIDETNGDGSFATDSDVN